MHAESDDLGAGGPAPRRASRAGALGRILLAYLTGFALIVLGLVVYYKTRAYYDAAASGGAGPFMDFDVFRLAGRMTRAGDAAATYDPGAFFAAELRESAGRISQLVPWAYPPQTNLAVTGLALLPKYLGYLLVEGGGLLALVLVLWRLAGRASIEVLFVAAPMALGGLVYGQNGVVTGCLTGWFALAMLRGRRSAGIPLGLLVIKPHLALGLGLYALVRREWSVVGIALGIVIASGLAATVFLTPAIWPAFLGGISQSGRMLGQDGFPHIELISGYAALRSLGLSATLAMAGQAVEAALAAWLIVYTASRRLGARVELGVAAIATLGFSPYAFDYDLPILAVGIALLWPVIAGQVSILWRGVLVVACYYAGAGFAVMQFVLGHDAEGRPIAIVNQPPALSSFAFLLILAATALMVRRRARARQAPVAQAHGRSGIATAA